MDFSSVGAAFVAVEKGAASVYHSILATGVQVVDWGEAHPMVGVLVADGLDYAQDALTRYGVPAGTVKLLAPDIIASLKHLAVLDATVASASSVTTTVVSQSPIGHAAALAVDAAAVTS